MIDVKKLFNKGERGTHKGKVKVTRGGKTFYREQMVGKKDTEKTKKPWQIPVGKFVMSYVQSKGDEIGRIIGDEETHRVRLKYQMEAVDIHAKAIKQAVKDNRKIPKGVLKDYPQYLK